MDRIPADRNCSARFWSGLKSGKSGKSCLRQMFPAPSAEPIPFRVFGVFRGHTLLGLRFDPGLCHIGTRVRMHPHAQ